MAGDGCEEAAAKEPKRRENMDAMVGDWFDTRRGRRPRGFR